MKRQRGDLCAVAMCYLQIFTSQQVRSDALSCGEFFDPTAGLDMPAGLAWDPSDDPTHNLRQAQALIAWELSQYGS